MRKCETFNVQGVMKRNDYISGSNCIHDNEQLAKQIKHIGTLNSLKQQLVHYTLQLNAKICTLYYVFKQIGFYYTHTYTPRVFPIRVGRDSAFIVAHWRIFY